MPASTILYHATDVAKLDSIMTEGMRGKSYWTDDAEVLAYYEETITDEGAVAIALVIDMTVLDAEHMQPDFPGLEEPLTFTLGMSEEAISDAWESSDKTWASSLSIIKTVRYCAVISPECLMVMDAAGEMHRLTDYAAGMSGTVDGTPTPRGV